MCISTKEVSKELREGVVIDLPIDQALQEAFSLLKANGYNQSVDVIHFKNNFQTHLTEVKYRKTTSEVVNGEKREINHYSLSIPDRYIPVTKEAQKETLE